MKRTVLAALLGLAACGADRAEGPATGGPETPTGSGAPAGGRPGHHIPDATSAYVPNPAITLPREYWRIFRTADGSHYMIPRPDGAVTLARECDREGPLAGVLVASAMCRPAMTQDEVARANRLTREDALAISTLLHRELRFVPEGGPVTLSPFAVAPWAPPDDILAVCAQSPQARAGALATLCSEEESSVGRPYRTPEVHHFTHEDAPALAREMNVLYGITASEPAAPRAIVVKHAGVRPAPCDGGTAMPSLAEYTLDVATRRLTARTRTGCETAATERSVELDAGEAAFLAAWASFAMLRSHSGCTADYGEASITTERVDGSSSTYLASASDSLCNQQGELEIPTGIFEAIRGAFERAMTR